MSYLLKHPHALSLFTASKGETVFPNRNESKKLRSIPSLSKLMIVLQCMVCLNVFMCIKKQASLKYIFYGNDDDFVGEAFLK